jgi:hypothetical protein
MASKGEKMDTYSVSTYHVRQQRYSFRSTSSHDKARSSKCGGLLVLWTGHSTEESLQSDRVVLVINGSPSTGIQDLLVWSNMPRRDREAGREASLDLPP